MTEPKASLILQEAKFMVIDEDSKATYADHLVAGYIQSIKGTTFGNHQIHLLLFVGPSRFYNYLFEIFGKDHLKIHDYFTSDINDFSKNSELDLNSILTNKDFNNESIVVVNCLSSLISTVGLAKASKFVEKLALRVGQLICIYNRDIYIDKFPSIETLGTTYIQLNRYNETVINNDVAYEISITHRKKGGNIWNKTLLAIQDIGTYEIKFETYPTSIIKSNVKSMSEPTLTPQFLATFRTDMNARELEQRNNTPLPYTLNCNTSNESKILYVPDDVDDFDEEDPDDDLPF